MSTDLQVLHTFGVRLSANLCIHAHAIDELNCESPFSGQIEEQFTVARVARSAMHSVLFHATLQCPCTVRCRWLSILVIVDVVIILS